MPRPKLIRPEYRLKLRGRIWTVTWTDPESGRTRAVSTGAEDEDEAKIWRDQWLAGQEQPLPPPQPLIRDILDGYLAARKPHVAAYDRLVFAAAVLKRHIGNLEPHMLARRAYLDRRQADGVSDGTIRREIGVLRAALVWAVRERWIEKDRNPFVEAPPSPPPRDRWLSRSELRRLIAGCGRSHVQLFVMTAYHTAARAGAVLDLTWDRVDLDARRIDYNRPGRPQTKKRRTVVRINTPLLTALQAARQAALDRIAERMPGSSHAQLEAELATRHVIEHHGRPVNSIKKGFAEACRRAGLEGCSPHTLRHTAATHMVMARVPLAEVARMLGDSEAVVEKVYGKHSPDYLRDASDALAGDFGPELVSDTLLEK